MKELEIEITKNNALIADLKSKLHGLLEEKRQLLLKQAELLGCTCGVMLIYDDASRLDNIFCKYHHPNG